MKTFRRTERCKGYSRITEVDETGRYEQYVEWPDGKTAGHYKTTLAKMGWKTLAEFISNRHGFEPINQ